MISHKGGDAPSSEEGFPRFSVRVCLVSDTMRSLIYYVNICFGILMSYVNGLFIHIEVILFSFD